MLGPGIRFISPNLGAGSVRRKALRLSKREVASRIGVHHEVIGMWERGEHALRVNTFPP